MDDRRGTTIGNYRIEAPLGVGGMGRVYRAVHIHIHRVAAIKVLHEQFAIDPAFQARFLREAQSVAALRHPNIVDVVDFNEDNGVFYLVMEYVPDGSLRSLLKEHAGQRRQLPLPVGLDLIRQAAEALDYANRVGMVHRDIKPDNLLLKRDRMSGEFIVKVADFGLARLGDSATLTTEGQTMGTPAYMSPEQCQGGQIDGRSDIYSLGVVLFEVVTGAVPFAMTSLTDAIYKHVYVAPPSPRDVRPDLPDDLSAIILRCLEKRPADRFATAGELAAALRGIVAAGVQDIELAPTMVEFAIPAERLRVVLDSGEVSLTPGHATALTVTIANLGDTPVQARIRIDGVPPEWIATPPPDVDLAPGAEVSGPLRVQAPANAGIGPGAYPVVVRAEARDNPSIRAEASTRLLIQPPITGPPTLAEAAGDDATPPGHARREPRSGLPDWLVPLVAILLLVGIGGAAYGLLRPGGGDDDDGGLIAGDATETDTIAVGQPVIGQRTPTSVVGISPAGDATATSTEAIAVAGTSTEATGGVATEPPVTPTSTEFIMFTSGRNLDDPAGTLDIYAMDPDGANQRPLISEPDDDWLADISPDGSRIVWASRRNGNHQIYIAGADGSEVRRLTNSSGDDLYPRWSPDGVQIVFTRNEDGDDEIYTLNVDDGTLRRLTDNAAYDGFAAWSPDGTWIAWTSGVDGNNEIYAIDVTDESSTPRRLTSIPANDFNPIWSPDGTRIVFVSNVFGDNDLLEIPFSGSLGVNGDAGSLPPVDSSQAIQLTNDVADEFAPAWSPDGSRIAFCRKLETHCQVVVLNVDGAGEQIPATNASPNDPDIVWSPDSDHLAYLSEDAGNYDVWTVALDGSQPLQLTKAPGNDANVTWFAPKQR